MILNTLIHRNIDLIFVGLLLALSIPTLGLAATGPVDNNKGYHIDHGDSAVIDAHGVKKKVTNNHPSGLTIYIPLNTSAEWASYVASPPPGVTVKNPDCVVAPWSRLINRHRSLASNARRKRVPALVAFFPVPSNTIPAMEFSMVLALPTAEAHAAPSKMQTLTIRTAAVLTAAT